MNARPKATVRIAPRVEDELVGILEALGVMIGRVVVDQQAIVTVQGNAVSSVSARDLCGPSR